MARNRARGTVRECAAILGATLLIAAIAPLPATAASPVTPRFTAVATRPDVATSHVDAVAASRLPRRTKVAAKQLPERNHPAYAGATSPMLRRAAIAKPNVVTPPPPLTVTHVTNTQSQADVLLEPPDPWVVANGSYVLSTSNGLVRVLNRTGSRLADIPTYALFDTDLLHYESDPRILWDAAHGRWVGVVVTYDDAFLDMSLTLAVSDSANPLGTWTTHRYTYGAEMPDYPGIASTADKIVLTSNLYSCFSCANVTYDGSAFQTVSWASLVTGGSAASAYQNCATCWNLRPARNSGAPTSDAYLVYEINAVSGDLYFLAITGPATSPSIGVNKDLGIPAGYYGPEGPDGTTGFDHQPRQPGGTITDAVDGRIPDVAMSASTLYFARTNQADLGGTAKDLVVQAYTVPLATALAGTPTYQVSTWGNKNEDYWMPGVGVSKGDPTAGPGYFLSYMVSSSSVAPQAFAAGSLDGTTFTDPTLVATSSGPYTSHYGRWGDFMGITPDPGGTMAVWSATEVSTAQGQWQEVIDRLVLDDTPPSVPGIPVQALVRGSSIGMSGAPVPDGLNLPVRVSWSTAADVQSGIRNYWIADEAGRGPITVATSFVIKVPAYRYGDPLTEATRFSGCAQNDAGLWSACSDYGEALKPVLFEQTLSYTKYSAGWVTGTGSAYSGGTVKASYRAGAYATFRMSGRSFGWVSYKASTRGKARVYVDGVYKATITLTSSVAKARNLVYAINYATSGTHTIKIVVVSGRVDVDGFVVLR